MTQLSTITEKIEPEDISVYSPLQVPVQIPLIVPPLQYDTYGGPPANGHIQRHTTTTFPSWTQAGDRRNAYGTPSPAPFFASSPIVAPPARVGYGPIPMPSRLPYSIPNCSAPASPGLIPKAPRDWGITELSAWQIVVVEQDAMTFLGPDVDLKLPPSVPTEFLTADFSRCHRPR
jgi:hypothetical protein